MGITVRLSGLHLNVRLPNFGLSGAAKLIFLELLLVISASFSTKAFSNADNIDLDNPEDQYNIGLVFFNGTDGVPENKKEAVKWYRMAAEQRFVVAQKNLGLMHHFGKGAPQDDKEAVKWFRQAAEQGDVVAQKNLGLMYDNGLGVTEDKTEAMNWYRMAAEQGDAGAQNNLATLLLINKPSKEDISNAKRYFELAFENGLGGGYAEASLGRHHFTGAYSQAIPLDYVKAFYWNELGAKAGHANAHSNMALHYFSGLGTSQSFEKMFGHLTISAELMTDKFRSVTEEPDEWLAYKSLAPAHYWAARGLWWQAVSTGENSYIDKLKLLKN